MEAGGEMIAARLSFYSSLFSLLFPLTYPCGGGSWSMKSASCSAVGLSAVRT
jgi:hypothetical protein